MDLLDSQQVRLSALGRDMQVGNLYNYCNNILSECTVEASKESISVDNKSKSKTQWFYLPHMPLPLKYDALGISAHLRNSIENNSVDLNQLWFADFLESSQSKDDTVAQVNFFFRVVRGTETLDPKFLLSKLNEFQLGSGDRATHLVEHVFYGAELICSLQRTFNPERETKEHAEGSLYLAAKEYFNQIFGCHSTNPDFPAALDSVECEILSSLDASNQFHGPCLTAVYYLRDALSFDEDDCVEKWKPIEITLRNIVKQIEALIQLEIQIGKKRHEITWKSIRKKSQNIMNNPYIDFVPFFKKMMSQFHGLLTPLWEKMDTLDDIFQTATPEHVLKEKEISNLLRDMIDWLIHRRFEIKRMLWLIKGTQLTVKDWAEVKTSNSKKRAKLFVMQAEYNQNAVVESIQKFIGTASEPVFPLLVIPILFADEERLGKMREESQTKFSEETRSNYSEWLRRQTANMLCSARVSSNLVLVDILPRKWL